jgi:hypothetical protein
MKKYAAIAVFLIFLASGIAHAQPSASGVRDIEAQNIKAGQSTNISITINNTVSQALSLQEKLPSGWALTRISDDANSFKASTDEWVWFSVREGEIKTIRYSITVPAGAVPGTYNIEGSISNSSGIITGVAGDSSIAVLGSVQTPTATQASGSSGQAAPAQTKTSAGLQSIEVSIIPIKPVAGDNITLKVELTYPTAGYAVEFGEASIKDRTILFNIKSTPPAGLAAQVITTYSHEYNLGYPGEGSYAYEVEVNNFYVKKGNFEVSPKSQAAPASANEPVVSPAANKPVKTPGFSLPIVIILISYIVLKIKTRERI